MILSFLFNIYVQDREESFIALNNVYILKYDGDVFQSILETFPEIKREMEEIALERERVRLLKDRQKNLIIDADARYLIFEALTKLLNKEEEEV